MWLFNAIFEGFVLYFHTRLTKLMVPRSSLAEERCGIYESYDSWLEFCFGWAPDQPLNPHHVPLGLGGQMLSTGCSKSPDGVSGWRTSYAGQGNMGHPQCTLSSPAHCVHWQQAGQFGQPRCKGLQIPELNSPHSAKLPSASLIAKLNYKQVLMSHSSVHRGQRGCHAGCCAGLEREDQKWHPFFLSDVAKSFSTFFTLSSVWVVRDWPLLTNPVSWLLKSHKRGKKAS